MQFIVVIGKIIVLGMQQHKLVILKHVVIINKLLVLM